MDFLNQAFAQATNLFRSMSVGARIVAALLLAVIVVSLTYLFNHRLAAPDSYLMGGEPIASDEINAITGALGEAGLKNFTVDGNRIRVPRGEEATYMAALLDGGVLPGSYGSYLEKALSDGGWLVSKAKQKELNKVAKQMELQRVIREMKGVRKALVLHDVQEEKGLLRNQNFSASVSVGTLAGQPLDEKKVMTIRHLVAAAFAGMPPESVTVTDLDTGFTYPSTKAGQPSVGMQHAYTQTKVAHEQLWTDKIRNALNYIPGVIVACNVDLNTQIEHEEQKTQYDPKTIPIDVAEETKTSTAQGPQPSGAPGLGSQGALPNQPAVARGTNGGSKTDEELSRSNVRSLPQGSQQHIKVAGLTPNRVTASIHVPSSFIEKVWELRNKATPGKVPNKSDLKLIEEEETLKIQLSVAQLIPLPDEAAADPVKQVRVTVYDKLPGEDIPEPGISDHALSWLGSHWSTLGTGLLGLVSLVMLRSMVRAAPAAEPLPVINAAAAAAAAQEEAEAVSNEPKIPAAARLRRRDKSGPSLREELVEVVREDPDAAANVLRSWINSST
jgi:flagellar M-ring protein FliF